MNSVNQDLRTKKSYYQELEPRKTMCSKCPHAYEVKTNSCDIYDDQMFDLEEPHICNSERDGLCRGVVEKMIMNGMTWKLLEER